MRRIITLIALILGFTTAFAQVPVDINSGNPKYPFPQFLDYAYGSHSLDNLGTVNAPGVTHAEMEQDISDAYQIMANRFNYTGESIKYDNGEILRYIKGNKGCPYDCSEGSGYAMLAAAYMGDKYTFDGLWARNHDLRKVKYPRYSDGVAPRPDYKYGTNTLAEPGGDAATDGDVDIALALLMAYHQWGEWMGATGANGDPISYKQEAMDVIRGLVEITDSGLGDGRSTSGNVGFDGYLKNGNTWGETTNWINTAALPAKPEYAGPTAMHVDYMAPGYFRAYRDFFINEGESITSWDVDQMIKNEASSDWIMGDWIYQDDSHIPWGGWVDVNNGKTTWRNFMSGEDFRSPWRTILNYVWHGAPDYTWNPTTHQVTKSSNTYEYDAAVRHAKFLKSPQAEPWNNACVAFGGGPELTYQGPATLQWEITPAGKGSSAFTLNWIPGTGTPAAVAAQDLDLLGQLYRQCVIEWDVTSQGDGYLTSEPVYFHGWFRLLGMLVASGNAQNPNVMLARPNLKVYRDIELGKTFAYTGDEITYELSYRNYGSVDALNSKIVEQVPNDFIFISATDGGKYDAGSHTVTWDLKTIKGFKTGNLAATQGKVSYKVKIGNQASGTYCTTAEISCSNGLGWTSNEYPNEISPTMRRNCIDVIARALMIDKYADREKANEGNIVQYTIDFENSIDAGWIDGGRPGVNIAFAHPSIATPDAFDQSGIKIRLFHDAVEPYIDYGNYRISYFINDAGLKCYVGDAGCNTGWDISNTIYEGGDATGVTVSHEEVTAGSDANGSWNQRLVVQFAPLLVTTTPHISNYYGLEKRIHRGGTEPLRAVWRVFPSNYNKTNWQDDWSWDPKAEDADGGLYFPVTPDWTDPKNPNIPVTKWHHNACETAPHSINNVLVEEFDGYVWRRVFGNGPIPGRDITNVVVRDTLPEGATFEAFVGKNPFGIAPKLITAGGKQIIEWSIPKLQANQGGQIVYTATVDFPSGADCMTDDEELINSAWIYGDNESPINADDTLIVTCADLPVVIEPTTLVKTADKKMYQVGDDITYTLEYTQTHGSIVNNAASSSKDWTGNSWTASGGTLTAIANQNSPQKTTFDYAYGQNGYLEGTVAQTGYAAYRILLRDGSANPITIALRKEWGNQLMLEYIVNGTSKDSYTILYGGAESPYTLKVDLNENLLRLWINGDTTESPIYSRNDVPIGEGYAGFINGGAGGAAASGAHKISDLHFHFDAGFNLKIEDPIPNEVDFASAENNGKEKGGIVTWEIPSDKDNPVPFGTVTTVTWTGTVNTCNTILENIAYVNMLGHEENSIAGQVVVDCGVSDCPEPPKVADVEYCKGATAVALEAIGTGTLTWYTEETGGKGSFIAPIPSTETAGTTSYWVTQTASGCESDRVEIAVTVIETLPPTATTPVTYCVGDTPTELEAVGTDLLWYTENTADAVGTETVPTPSTTDANTVSYWVTQTENGCVSERTEIEVTVNEAEVPTVTSPINYCKDEAVTPLSVTVTGTANWHTDPVLGTGGTIIPIPTTNKIESTSYYVSNIDNGCESKRVEIVVNVSEPKTPTVVSPVEYCQNDVAEELTATLLGTGTLTWYTKDDSDAVGTEIAPTPSTTTAGSTSYFVSEVAGSCESPRAEIVVKIKPQPIVTLDPVSNVCISNEEFALTSTATPIGGTGVFSGTGVSGSNFDPATAGEGIHEVTYTYTLEGCSNDASINIEVEEIPTVDFTLPTTACYGDEAIALLGTPTGGTFTATPSLDVNSGFDPATATAGQEYTIKYDYDNGVCSNSIEKEITAYNPTTPVGVNNSEIYTKVISQATVPEISATGTNIEWYSDETLTTLVGNGDTYQADANVVIDAANQGKPGKYTYYAVSTEEGCKSKAVAVTLEITSCTVLAPIPVTTSVEMCFGDTNPLSQTLEVTADAGNNIIWYSKGVEVQNSAETSFVSSKTEVGSYQFEVSQYSPIEDCESPKATITLIIHDLPTVNFDPAPIVCEKAPIIDLTKHQSQVDGTILCVEAGTNCTTFDPNTTPGEYKFTYSYTDLTTGCSNSTDATIEVHALPKPTISAIKDMCTYNEQIDLTTFATPNPGTFSGDGVVSNQFFNPSLIVAGTTAKISYLYNDGTCEDSVSASINVFGPPSITFNEIPNKCEGSEDFDLSAFVSPKTGTFKGTGVSGTDFSPATSGVGKFPVDYIVSENGCTDTLTENVKVVALPTVGITVPSVICYNGEIETPVLEPIVGGTLTLDGTEVTNIAPTAYEAGTFSLVYSYTDGNGCVNADTVEIEIREVTPPTVVDQTELILNPNLDIAATSNITGGTISWQKPDGTAISTGTTMTHTETIEVGSWEYCAIDNDGTCKSEPSCMTYTIIDCPTPAPTINGDDKLTFCQGDEIPSPTFTATGTGSITWYDADRNTTEADELTCELLPTDVGTFTWTATQFDNGCEGAAATVSVTINPLPTVTVTAPEVICHNETEVTPTGTPAGGTFTYDGIPVTSIDPTTKTPDLYDLIYSYTEPTTNCTNTTTQTVEIREIVAPTVTNKTILINETDISITATTSGGDMKWYNENRDLIGTGTTIDHQIATSVVGDYTYCVTETDGTCESEPACMLFSVINCPNPAPIVENPLVVECINNPIPSLTASKTDETLTLLWYKKSDLNTHIFEGEVFTPATVNLGLNEYFVGQYDGSCVGPKVAASIQINETPAVTIFGNKEICEGDEITLTSNVNTGTVSWYTTDPTTGGMPIGTGYSYTFTGLASGLNDVWAIHEDDCFSIPTLETIVVNTVPDAPALSGNEVCEGSPLTVSAVGNGIEWYNAGGSTVISTENDYSIQSSVAKVYEFKATQTVNGCTSEKASISVESFEIPEKPIANDVNICAYDNIVALTATSEAGAETNWYSDATLTNNIAADTEEYIPASKLTQTVYVTQTLNGCTSEAQDVTFTVFEKPTEVTFNNTSQVCVKDPVTIIVSQAGDIKWYAADVTNASVIANGRYFTPNTDASGEYTYYATQTINGCESDKAPIDIKVVDGPKAPIIINDAIICENDNPATIEAKATKDGENIYWANSKGQFLASGAAIEIPKSETPAAGVYTFYARTTVDGCAGFAETPVRYEVSPSPLAPTLKKDNFCYEGSPVTLEVVKGANVMWYDENKNVINDCALSNKCTPQITTSGVFTYYISQTLNDCVSPLGKLTVDVSEVETPMLVGKDEVCIGSTETYSLLNPNAEYTYVWNATGNHLIYEVTEDLTKNYSRSVDWLHTGIDTISVIAFDKYKCTAESSVATNIAPIPQVDFTAEHPGAEGLVRITNTTPDQIIEEGSEKVNIPMNYYWDYGATMSKVDTLNNKKSFKLKYRYGNYTVQVTGVNDYGCKASAEHDFLVEITHGLYVPDAFSPTNAAHGVRTFKPVGYNLEEFEMWIFDAWGNIVWYTDGVDDSGSPVGSWDGKSASGALMTSGAYTWRIDAKFADGTTWDGKESKQGKFKKRGTVYLIR